MFAEIGARTDGGSSSADLCLNLRFFLYLATLSFSFVIESSDVRLSTRNQRGIPNISPIALESSLISGANLEGQPNTVECWTPFDPVCLQTFHHCARLERT